MAAREPGYPDVHDMEIELQRLVRDAFALGKKKPKAKPDDPEVQAITQPRIDLAVKLRSLHGYAKRNDRVQREKDARFVLRGVRLHYPQDMSPDQLDAWDTRCGNSL